MAEQNTATTQTPQPKPRSSLAMASDLSKALRLAPTFQPDVDLLTAEGLIAFGVKGSGKSNLVALLVEQLGRFLLPQIILDTEREQHSLVNLLPHGVIATASRCPSGYDILHKGLQVILDVQSWDTDEAAALAMCQLIHELFTSTNAQAPQDRVPCVIHLDEAACWLPQEAVTYLSKDIRKALADAFHKLASRGRKQGLTPFLYTQSISEVAKSAIRQAGVKVLMRQTLDVDLTRYCQYIQGATAQTRKAIQAYPSGKAIVILPDGSQHRVQFNERQSEHVGHTPQVQAALIKFAAMTIDVTAIPMRDMAALAPAQSDQPQKPPQPTALRHAQSQDAEPPKAKHAPEIRERVFTLLEKDPTLTPRQLAAIVGCPTNTAQIYRKEHGAPPAPKKTSKIEQRLRALLAENPQYTPSQLAHRTNYSLRDVRTWLARIQESASSHLAASHEEEGLTVLLEV